MSYGSKALSRRHHTGVRTALPQRNRRSAKLTGLQATIRARFAAHLDTTIADLRRWLQTDHQITISVGVMWSTLKRLNLALKKSLWAAEQDRPKVAAARKQWRDERPRLNLASLVFIDG